MYEKTVNILKAFYKIKKKHDEHVTKRIRRMNT